MLNQRKNICVFTAMFILLLLLITSSPVLAEGRACSSFTAGTFNGSPACVKDGKLHLCKNNFPEYSFRTVLIKLYDPDQDLLITQSEAAQILEIKCDHRSIATMDGISFFINLETLDCSDNLLKNLDVSKNPRLKTLICRGNDLSYITINNKELTYLDCSNNNLSALNTISAENLLTLKCDANRLTALNISAPNLVYLSAVSNSISQFHLDNYPALQELYCGSNQLTHIASESVSGLKLLHCSKNLLTQVPTQNLPHLEQLICDSNQISSLDLRCTPLLEELSCSSNRIPSLDLTACSMLRSANIRSQDAITAHITPLPDRENSIVDIGALVGKENLSRVSNVHVMTYPARKLTYDASSGIATISGNITRLGYTLDLSCPSPHTLPQMEIIVTLECTHNWTEATCTLPRICTACNTKTGECLPHSFAPANQTTPPKCTVCGHESGHPLEHVWLGETCTNPSKCAYCNETKGTAPGHDWISELANCIEEQTCTVCGLKNLVKQVHDWAFYGCYNKCRKCATVRHTQGHNWDTHSCMKKCKVCGMVEIIPGGKHTWYTSKCTLKKCVHCNATQETNEHTFVNTSFFTPGHCKKCGLIYESSYLSQYLLGILSVMAVMDLTAAVWYLLDYRRIRKY